MGIRKELAKREGERKKFRAVFDRVGKKAGFRGYSKETLLLKNVIDVESNRLVADHVWFDYSRGFQEAGLKEGMPVEFEARVKRYSKGYVNTRYGIDRQTHDYRLSHPTKIKVIRGPMDTIGQQHKDTKTPRHP